MDFSRITGIIALIGGIASTVATVADQLGAAWPGATKYTAPILAVCVFIASFSQRVQGTPKQ